MQSAQNEGWGFVLAVLAPRQAGVVSRAQLLAAGLDRSAIQRALHSARLHPVHRGVYALLPLTALPTLARHHAALLACGPRAALSHHTAAQVHGLLPFVAAEIHVTSTDDRRRPGLVVHRTDTLPKQDRARVGRLSTTSIPRTVRDLSHVLDDRAFERLVDESLKHVPQSKLISLVRARRLIDGDGDGDGDGDRPSSLTWSVAEERLRQLIHKAGLPAPESNVMLGYYRPDLLWREQRVIVEFDSYTHHSGPAAFHHDRDRHNALTTQGYTVIHVTWRQLTTTPEQVLVWIAVALARADA